MDALLDLVGREVDLPGSGKVRQVGLESVDRIQAEEGGCVTGGVIVTAVVQPVHWSDHFLAIKECVTDSLDG